jgi:hypothetical protein
MCRDFETKECKQANQLAELNRLKAPSGANNILSITLSIQGADVESEEINQVSAALSILKETGIVEDGVMGVERGSANDHLHIQVMLHGRFLRSTRKRKQDGDSTHQSVLKAFFNEQNCFNRSLYCFVRVHETSAEVSWESMAGCDVTLVYMFSCAGTIAHLACVLTLVASSFILHFTLDCKPMPCTQVCIESLGNRGRL